jgi:hypothetical protein
MWRSFGGIFFIGVLGVGSFKGFASEIQTGRETLYGAEKN